MTYAIIETGGKQYRVEENDIIDVERIPSVQGPIEFKNVLFFNNGVQSKVGTPYVPESVVQGELLGEAKGKKEISFKYKQRKGVRRKVGHRQKYHRVKITKILG